MEILSNTPNYVNNPEAHAAVVAMKKRHALEIWPIRAAYWIQCHV
jgi:hypothetical protein